MKRQWINSPVLALIAVALAGVVNAAALTGYTLDRWTVKGHRLYLPLMER